MTLITWIEGAKGIRRRISQLAISATGAKYMGQFAYLQFDFVEYFGRTMAKVVSHSTVLPTYAPFIPYAGLANVLLYYKPQSSEEYHVSTPTLFSQKYRWSDFYSYNLLKSLTWFNISLGLADSKHLVINSNISPYRDLAVARLLPQLLL